MSTTTLRSLSVDYWTAFAPYVVGIAIVVGLLGGATTATLAIIAPTLAPYHALGLAGFAVGITALGIDQGQHESDTTDGDEQGGFNGAAVFASVFVLAVVVNAIAGAATLLAWGATLAGAGEFAVLIAMTVPAIDIAVAQRVQYSVTTLAFQAAVRVVRVLLGATVAARASAPLVDFLKQPRQPS